jgi:hypothetical protein
MEDKNPNIPTSPWYTLDMLTIAYVFQQLDIITEPNLLAGTYIAHSVPGV